MRRLFNASKTYIFVAPIAMAMSDNGGCGTTQPGPLTSEQVQSVIVGNTFQKDDGEAYAFVDMNGQIRGTIETDDGVKTDRGVWVLDKAGKFCVKWEKAIHTKNNCSQFVPLENNQLNWGGHTFARQEGNPRNL